MKRQTGMTLIEMVVALAIFAVIYVVAHGTLGYVLDNSAAITKEQRHWQQLSIAFSLLEEDLTFSTDRKVRGIDGVPLRPFDGRPDTLRSMDHPALELTRSGIRTLATGTETGMRRVAWRLEDKRLYRDVWPVLDRAPDSAPVSQLVLQDVASFDLRFYQQGGQTVDSWPVESFAPDGKPLPTPPLPNGVELTLTFGDGVELKRVFLVNG